MGANFHFSESTSLIIQVVSSILQLIGILLSLFRLWFRMRIGRLWWEDAWSFVACICAILLLTSGWICLKDDWVLSVVGFWAYSLVFTCVVWAVRMSMLFSIARIVYSTERMRHLVAALATIFSLSFLIFIALKVWWYTQDPHWLKATAFHRKPGRLLPHPMYVYELFVDCISDTILFCFPVRLLWTMNLPPKQRRMITVIFSAGIIVTLASAFRAVSQLRNLGSLVALASDFEAAFSIINCNLLVVVTLIYRLSRRASSSDVPGPGVEDDDYTTPIGDRVTPLELTTVDLSALDCSKDSSQLAEPRPCLQHTSSCGGLCTLGSKHR